MSLVLLNRIAPDAASPAAPRTGLAFDTVYANNVSFVWRAARRLAIDASEIEDVVQEVFVVAHRRLPEFEGRASIKTWLFKILIFVIRRQRRTHLRKPGNRVTDALVEPDTLCDDRTRGPAEAAERADAVRVLDGLLAQLDSEKREVFVLAEIEQLSSVEP